MAIKELNVPLETYLDMLRTQRLSELEALAITGEDDT